MSEIMNNKIPASILSALYKDVLIHEPTLVHASTMKNWKAVVVVSSSNESLSPAAETLLNGILSACALDASNVVVLKSTSSKKENLSFIKAHFNTQHILLFGTDPIEFGLPIAFPHFQIQQSNGILYLTSPGLDAMLDDPSSKAKLWKGLKQIFLS